jgi:lysophospholipase L1-like esterase
MKPWRIFIFFTAVALLLLILALLFPGQGVTISRNIHLQFMKPADLQTLSDAADKAGNVEKLLAASTVTEDPEEDYNGGLPVAQENLRPGRDLKDSLEWEADSAAAPEPIVNPANVDSLKEAVFKIEFPEGKPDLLDPFFRKLTGLKRGTLARTRIIHFGDSQIEMDRMTALIRYRLQRQFGGSGTGLVQAVPLYSGHMAYDQTEEGQWLRFTFFGSRDSTINHRSYGIMGAFTSVPSPSGDRWPALHYTFNTARRTGTFDRVKIFLHSYADSALIAVMVNDTITDTLRNLPGGFSVADYRHHSGIRTLSLYMDLPHGGRIYGISFESYNGLQMDNIAMRGGSGLIFTKMNRELQIRMMEYLSPGLLILQFGGNVVPYINATRYQRGFAKELAFLHEVCPSVPIIVIGPSDMSLKEKGRFETYPGVEPVRDALRKAALNNGCAFWDLYGAMGGQNSMPSFVQAEPPLASTDYVHFTALGVNLVAEMFYNALMVEYNTYLGQSK